MNTNIWYKTSPISIISLFRYFCQQQLSLSKLLTFQIFMVFFSILNRGISMLGGPLNGGELTDIIIPTVVQVGGADEARLMRNVVAFAIVQHHARSQH